MASLQERDPVKKQEEIQMDSVLSPMDPPEAYAPPVDASINYAEMHPFLQELWNQHDDLGNELTIFESAIMEIEKEGITRDANLKLRNFFEIYDDKFLPHHAVEDKILFPLLAQRLEESGEHSQGSGTVHTAVDLMEEEHIQSLQLAATIFNIFALSTQLPDEPSRLVALDTALQQGKQFIELIRLHIFRENTIVYARAHELITSQEFDELQSKLSQNAN